MTLLLIVLLASLLLISPASAQGGRTLSMHATRLSAVHQNGQTFLTWDDADIAIVKGYRVLGHTLPITAENAAEADVIAPFVGPAAATDYISAAIRNDRLGFIISDLAEPLNPGTGLYVHSATRKGTAYYAIASLTAEGDFVGGIETCEFKD